MSECSKLKVPINKPKGIKGFLDALSAIRHQKRKAANMLFEEIEADVIDKEKFVLEQTEKLKQMNESYLTMTDYEKVLESVGKMVPRMRGGQGQKSSMYGGININETESK